ncbi:hypothetical protein [Mucilaginibacter arboris]|uniref:Uncharacterized protein n=1 Tax=Mucilaginibacter arboris TaxID=2682090 RepID=A0A7K1SXE6_9SPHI|nr:hypothetical protein [Mucilaginibacter arboris]MVN21918.1 hypothetical protein [Mucilaginibacter arboris]
MSSRYKKIFLAFSIVVPFMLYCVYYYGMMISNAPYKFTEFEFIDFKYGEGNNLNNTYNSKTGRYQYVNNHDSLVVKTVHLNKDDLLYLHHKAAELGFWNFPKEVTNVENDPRFKNSPHYFFAFHYQRKTKEVMFDEAFNGDVRLKDAAMRLAKEIEGRLADAEDREK